jgi:transcriptional regulator with PAS, ATPase and Fis domain
LHDPQGSQGRKAVEIVRDETEQMRLSKEYATIKREMERQAGFENIITQSKAMKSIFGLIEKIDLQTAQRLLPENRAPGRS